MGEVVDPAARAVVDALSARGWTLATGESLTAGLVAATVAEVPGCSAVLRGGVIAYDADVKARLLDVSEADLAQGLVSEAVASALACGARDRLGASVGLGTTGVAGPDPHDGEPIGSVWIAVAGPRETRTRHLSLAGDRDQIRRQTVAACFALLRTLLDE